MPKEVAEVMTALCSRIAVLGLWLGSLVAPAMSVAAPSEPTSEGATPVQAIGLTIWVDPAIPESKRLSRWLDERGALVLRQHQLQIRTVDFIRVEVSGEQLDYRIRVTLLQSGQPLPDQPDVIACECGSDEVLDRVSEAIVVGARRLTDAAAAREAAEQEQTREKVEPQVPVDTGTKRRRLGALGYAGIGVSVLGVGVVGAGIPLALRRDDIRGGPGEIETRSTRGAGIGLAVGGGVALAAGVSLLVVDLVRNRQRKVAVTPLLAPWQVGVAIAWRARGIGTDRP